VTRFLASIAAVDELPAALEGGADLIDVKDPATGALGAADLDTIRAIVTEVRGRRPVSATLGDLPMRPERLVSAARRTAAAGVGFVKAGIFPDGDADSCIAALAAVAAESTRLVAVLFADRHPRFELLDSIAAAGFAGAMLDTAGKGGCTLTDHLSLQRLLAFIEQARSLGLMTGLAGSLRLEHVAPLAALGPDYLGFRGALCAGGRASAIELARVRRVRQALDAASNATAAAGALIAAASRTSAPPSTSSAKSR
jgi:uncharacterized protein (UPF0264 family)